MSIKLMTIDEICYIKGSNYENDCSFSLSLQMSAISDKLGNNKLLIIRISRNSVSPRK